jgi:hypothetical protein
MSQEWIEKFLSQYSSPGSRRVYRSDLEDLVGYVERNFPLKFPALAEEHALDWRAHLDIRTLAPSTIARCYRRWN